MWNSAHLNEALSTGGQNQNITLFVSQMGERMCLASCILGRTAVKASTLKNKANQMLESVDEGRL